MSTSLLLWGLLFSSIGLGYFIYGRKQGNKVALYSGVALMGYSYFVTSVIGIIVIGIGLMLVPRFVKF